MLPLPPACVRGFVNSLPKFGMRLELLASVAQTANLEY